MDMRDFKISLEGHALRPPTILLRLKFKPLLMGMNAMLSIRCYYTHLVTTQHNRLEYSKINFCYMIAAGYPHIHFQVVHGTSLKSQKEHVPVKPV